MKWSIILKKERDRLEAMEANMHQLYRWCAEFNQMCDCIDYIREVGGFTEHIDQFRDRMRKKYEIKG